MYIYIGLCLLLGTCHLYRSAAGNGILMEAQAIQMCSAAQARQKTWSEMSKGLRAWFNGPEPGAPRTSNEEEFEKPPPEGSDPAVPSFGLVVMDIEEVDYVDLLNNQRQVYHGAADVGGVRQWKEQALNP